MIDLNSSAHKHAALSDAINVPLSAAILKERQEQPQRAYLGASAIGPGCKRAIQWKWTKGEPFEAQTLRIFDRGHWGEAYVRKAFAQAGYMIQNSGKGTSFSQLNGKFSGHCDGVFRSGPDGIRYPALWEMKTLGDKGSKDVAKYGLKKAKPGYYSQINLYMAYLCLTDNPAIFTVMNANTMAIDHYAIPFDSAEAQAASDLAVQIIDATEHGETLPRVSDDPQFYECRYCPFNEQCHG